MPAPVEVEVSALMIHDEKRNLILCTRCKQGIHGKQKAILNHLRDTHKDEIGAEERAMLASHLASKGAIDDDDIEGIDGAKGQGYSKHLTVHMGFSCGHEGCSFLTTQEGHMQRHQRKIHKMSTLRYRSSIPMSTIFNARKSYFIVSPPQEEMDAMTAAPAIASALEAIYAEYGVHIQRQRENLAKTAADVPEVEINVWHRRTRYPQQFADTDMVEVHKLADFEHGCDPPRWAKLVRAATETMVKNCYDGLRSNNNILVRQLFQSTSQDVSQTPLDEISQAALEKYTNTWCHFMLWILRARQHWPKLQVNNSQGVLLDNILHSSTIVASRPDPTNVELCQLSRDVFKLSASMLRQKITNDAFQSPLTQFLGVQCYNPEMKRWRDPVEHRTALARVLYILRIIGMEDALPVASRAGLEFTTIAKEYTAEYLHHGSDSVFTWLHSLQKFAKTLSEDFYVRASVLWHEDRRALNYCGDIIRIDALRGMTSDMLGRAQSLLCQMVFRGKDYLLERSPGRFKDNLPRAANGESFVDRKSNCLQEGHRRVLEWAVGSENGKICREAALGSEDQARNALHALENQDEELRKLMVVAFNIVWGLPARVTELTSLKHSNSANTMRNFFIVEKHIAAVADYNKTEAMTGKIKAIPRFLPEEWGQIYIGYVADVIPFLDFMRLRAGGISPGTATSPFLFQSAGKPWSTDMISRLLGDETEKGLGVRLGVQSWRQIAVAVDNELVQGRDKVPSHAAITAINHAMQAGHTLETEKHHYALRLDELCGLTQDTFREFLAISRAWYEVISGRGPGDSDADMAENPQSRGLKAALSNISRELAGLRDEVCQVKALIQVGLPNTEDGEPTQDSGGSDNDNDGDDADNDEEPSPLRLVAKKRRRLDSTRSSRHIEHPPADDDASLLATKVLKSLFGEAADFRSSGQREAVETVLGCQDDVVVKLPTAAGKSLVIMASAFSARDRVTIVVVPTIALRKNLQETGVAMGIQSVIFKANNVFREVPLIFVTPESAATLAFATFIDGLITGKRLARIIFDECHTLVMDHSFRPKILEMARIVAKLDVQKVCMSATLSNTAYEEMCERLRLGRARGVKMVAEITDKPNISYEVVRLQDREYRWFLMRQLEEQRERNRRLLICVKTRADAEYWGRELGLPAYHAGMPDKDKDATLLIFSTGGCDALIGTSAIGLGINISRGDKILDMVIQVGGSYGLTTIVQQAGRAGRDGETVRSIILLPTPPHDQRPGSGMPCFRENACRNAPPILHDSIDNTPAVTEDILAMYAFIETTECRRRAIQALLDGRFKDKCSGNDSPCDNCLNSRPGDFIGFCTDWKIRPGWIMEGRKAPYRWGGGAKKLEEDLDPYWVCHQDKEVTQVQGHSQTPSSACARGTSLFTPYSSDRAHSSPMGRPSDLTSTSTSILTPRPRRFQPILSNHQSRESSSTRIGDSFRRNLFRSDLSRPATGQSQPSPVNHHQPEKPCLPHTSSIFGSDPFTPIPDESQPSLPHCPSEKPSIVSHVSDSFESDPFESDPFERDPFGSDPFGSDIGKPYPDQSPPNPFDHLPGKSSIMPTQKISQGALPQITPPVQLSASGMNSSTIVPCPSTTIVNQSCRDSGLDSDPIAPTDSGQFTLRRAVDSVMDLYGSCLVCWIIIGDQSVHQWFHCPNRQRYGITLTPDLLMTFTKQIRAQRNLVGLRIHYLCFLGLNDFHPDASSWKERCRYTDLVVTAVMIAVQAKRSGEMAPRLEDVWQDKWFMCSETELPRKLMERTGIGDTPIRLTRAFVELVIRLK